MACHVTYLHHALCRWYVAPLEAEREDYVKYDEADRKTKAPVQCRLLGSLTPSYLVVQAGRSWVWARFPDEVLYVHIAPYPTASYHGPHDVLNSVLAGLLGHRASPQGGHTAQGIAGAVPRAMQHIERSGAYRRAQGAPQCPAWCMCLQGYTTLT